MKKLFLKNRDGQSIIEFAVLLPILLMVIFGITEFGRAILVKNVLHTAAREGARLATIASSDSLSVDARVREVLNAGNVVPKEIIIQYFPNPPDKKVVVTVTTDFEVLSGGILDPFMGTFELRGKTVMGL